MSKGLIYKITNQINNKIYVGCTINNLEQRFYEHIYRCFKTDYNSKLYNSMKKYGVENFKIELLEECELGVIYQTEKKYIEMFDSFNNGMNSTLGGEGCLGYTHSAEIRKKISNNTKNGNSHKGKTYLELYGTKAENEKLKRKLSVKNSWSLMNEDTKKARIEKIKKVLKNKSKYNEQIITEIKEQMKNKKISELKKIYPNFSHWFFYQIKNGKL